MGTPLPRPPPPKPKKRKKNMSPFVVIIVMYKQKYNNIYFIVIAIVSLFCLQDGLKERELCVFFRNNHFSTMFKVQLPC